MHLKILRLSEVIALTGLSRSTIDRLESANAFPQRRQLGQKAVGWIDSEIKDWIERLAQKNVHTIEREQREGGSHEK